MRLTANGYLKESGYTFEAAAAERRREQRVVLLVAVFSGIVIAALVLFLTQRG